MNFKKWKFSQVDVEYAKQLADECDIDQLLAYIACARGYCDALEIEQFLSKEPEFGNPYDLSGMREAVDRIRLAIESNEKILIYGDYDCDGVSATALLCKYLKSCNADVDFAVPHRERDGYGINIPAIDVAHDNDVNLIITVDNGINAVKEIDYANELGIDIVITDHHIPFDKLPNAVAVIDPRIDEFYDEFFKNLSGVGVAFMLVCAIDDTPPEEMMYIFADLVALGTIGDLVPLLYDNRILVSHGVKLINKKSNLGIRALCDVAQLSDKYVSANTVAFGICPRINAAGRMDDATIAVNLLLSSNYDDAFYYATILNNLNLNRQAIETEIFEEAVKTIEENGYDNDNVIVVDGFGWKSGVVGIVASRLVERYSRPCIVISSTEDECVGSGRSIQGFPLFDAISDCEELLVKFGGHEIAAGLTVTTENLPKFRQKINEVAEEYDVPFKTINIDCKIKPTMLDIEVAKSIKQFEPFGSANPVVMFALMKVEIKDIFSIGNDKHTKIRFLKDDSYFTGLLFNISTDSLAFGVGMIVDIAVNLEVNKYNNNENLSIIIKDIKMSNVAEDDMISQIVAVRKLAKHGIDSSEAQLLLPNRNDIGRIYKLISSREKICRAFVENYFLSDIGFAKISVAIQALIELELVKSEEFDGKVWLAKTEYSGKTDLNNSKLLQYLKQKVGEVIE